MEDDKRRQWKVEKQLYDAFLKASCVSSSCNNWIRSHTVKATQIYFLPDHLSVHCEEKSPAVTQWKMWKSVVGKILKLVCYVYCRGVRRWRVSTDGLLICPGCVWLLVLIPELWLEISSSIMCENHHVVNTGSVLSYLTFLQLLVLQTYISYILTLVIYFYIHEAFASTRSNWGKKILIGVCHKWGISVRKVWTRPCLLWQLKTPNLHITALLQFVQRCTQV